MKNMKKRSSARRLSMDPGAILDRAANRIDGILAQGSGPEYEAMCRLIVSRAVEIPVDDN